MSKKVLIAVLVAVLVVGAVATYFAKPDLFKGSLFSVGAEQCKTYQEQWKTAREAKDVKKMQVYTNLYTRDNYKSILAENIRGVAIQTQSESSAEQAVSPEAAPSVGPEEVVSPSSKG